MASGLPISLPVAGRLRRKTSEEGQENRKEKEEGKEKGRFRSPTALLLALTYGLHSPAILRSKIREP
jgi:hypothetical protein